jgi:transcriptional regulator with XRE-family HTH domain
MLNETMKKFDLSQKELAVRLDVSPAYISQVISGKRPLSDKVKNKIDNLQLTNGTTSWKTIVGTPLDDIIRVLVEHEEQVDNALYTELMDVFTI